MEGDNAMSNLIPGNQKHLTLVDRMYIESSLNDNLYFKEIAKYLCKDPTTISKEVRKHRIPNTFHKGSFVSRHNFCTKRFTCKRINVCDKIIICDTKCASCLKCNQVCNGFVKERCKRLDRAPYVCNGCDKPLHRCSIAAKYHYNSKAAHRRYSDQLSSAREGINMTTRELHQLDMLITPLIAQGQSPYQILTNHPEINLSVRTLYQYINDGHFTARNIDLKRKPKFKPRKTHKAQITDRAVFVGRTYSDFSLLNPPSVVEMDTVHSSRASKKVLLTFYVRKEKLFLAFLLNRNTKGEVRRIFNLLERRLSTFDFITLFQYILTDRGPEFGSPELLETGINGIERTSIYYCDPMRSGQKGGVENVHTMLRCVLPKGTSFEYLRQWDINLIVNHINSTPRASLKGQTPYQLALETFGEDILQTLQLKRINPDEVNLTPKLIK